MKSNIFVILLTFCLLQNSTAQQLPANFDGRKEYDEGVEMFNKRLFIAAQKQFQLFIGATAHDNSLKNNDIYANAHFYDAICAYQLNDEDMEPKLLRFLETFPEHSRIPYTQYCLGVDYFERYKYADARSFLNAAKQSGADFTEDEAQKMNFDLAYCYFMEADYVNSAGLFAQLANKQTSPYYEDAAYYDGLCAYQNKLYDRALSSFYKVEKSAKYGKQMPILIANILLNDGIKNKNYSKLFEYAQKLEEDKTNEDPQVYYVVANAAYQQKDYEKCNKYFDLYTKAGQKMDRSAYFRQGYALYELKKYEKASLVLDKVNTVYDSLGQAASYYMGFCFLKENKNEKALYAYKKAAQDGAGTNPKVSEDAAYQHAKLCFATQNYSDAMTALNTLVKKYPQAVFISEAKEMIAEILSYSQNYPAALEYFGANPPATNRAKAAYQVCCYYYGIECVGKSDFANADKYLSIASDASQDKKMASSASFWLAESKYKQKRYGDAINGYETYKNLSNTEPNDYSMANYGIAWANFELKQYKYAAMFFEQYLKNAPNDIYRKADAYLRMGDSYFIQKDYKKSNKSYIKVVDLNYIEQDYAFYQIAEGDYRQQKYENAVANFNKLITQYKSSEWRDNALDRIAEIYLTWLEEPEKAKTFSTTLIQEYPRNPLLANAYNRLAQIAFQKDDVPTAIAYYKKVLADFTFDTDNCKIALENLSSALEPAEYDAVLNDYKKRNPNANSELSDMTFKTAQERFYAGNYLAAISLFNNFLSANTGGENYWEALFLRAESYKATTQGSLALTDYASIYNAPAQNAYTSKALDAAAKLKYDDKDYKGSLELYKTLEINSQRIENKTNATFGIAKNQIALKDYQTAIYTLNAIEMNPELDAFTKAKATLWTANANYGLKKYEESLVIYRKIAVENNDENGEEAQFMIVKTLYTQSKFKDSFEAGKFMKNNFADGQWKDRTILWMAEDCVALGDVFQAKSLLEGLASSSTFKDIAKFAEERLNKLKADGK